MGNLLSQTGIILTNTVGLKSKRHKSKEKDGIIISHLASSTLPLIFSACTAIFVAFTAPLVMIYINNKARRDDREAEWAHQDALAARAEQMQQATMDKVDVVHTLVNADKTAAMQRELDSAQRELMMMKQIEALQKRAGEEADISTLSLIATTQARIKALEIELAERYRIEGVVAQQIKDHPSGEIGAP